MVGKRCGAEEYSRAPPRQDRSTREGRSQIEVRRRLPVNRMKLMNPTNLLLEFEHFLVRAEEISHG